MRLKALCTSTSESNYSDIYSFSTACSSPASAITIWNPNNYSTSSVVPLRTSSTYSLSYTLFSADELGYIGRDIDTIAFRYYSSLQNSRNIRIAMAEADIDQLDWNNINTCQFQQVFSGEITFNQAWNYIVLDQSFSYSGMSNIIISLFDTTGTSNSYSYFCGTYGNYQTLYSYSYGDSIYDLYYNQSSTSFRPDIYFGAYCDMNPCHTPHIDSLLVNDSLVSLYASNITTVSIPHLSITTISTSKLMPTAMATVPLGTTLSTTSIKPSLQQLPRATTITTRQMSASLQASTTATPPTTRLSPSFRVSTSTAPSPAMNHPTLTSLNAISSPMPPSSTVL